MKHGSLFSGIGGFDLASEWMGWENVFQVEIDEFCQKVLTKNFPNVKRYRDIKEFKGQRGSVDILTGGFPCQPFSKAGKKRGANDNRYLWPEMFRIIKECQPEYIVCENVYGIIKIALNTVLYDLESEGYQTETFIIPAYAVGAFHNRDRVWIICFKGDSHDTNTNSIRSYKKKKYKQGSIKLQHKQVSLPGSLVSESVRNGTDPRVFRDINGIPNRVDRLKGLGNAIVPHVAYELFLAIQQLHEKGP